MSELETRVGQGKPARYGGVSVRHELKQLIEDVRAIRVLLEAQAEKSETEARDFEEWERQMDAYATEAERQLKDLTSLVETFG